MTVQSLTSGPALGGSSALECAARAATRRTLARGTVCTLLLMVLPGLLSSEPVGNGLTGAVVGLSVTVVAALGVYVAHCYVAPYLRVRRMITAGATEPQADEDGGLPEAA